MKKLLFLLIIVMFAFGNACFAVQVSDEELDKYLSEHTLVIIKDNKIIFHDENGIQPLINAINNKELEGAFVADRITGKAAALLYVYGGVTSVYSQVMAKPAVKILKRYKITYRAKTTTKYIINRQKTGLCPMEQKVLKINNPQKAWDVFTLSAPMGLSN